MSKPVIRGNLGHQNDHEDEPTKSSSSSSNPKKQTKDKKNPYSTRGLDKFSALLDDLEKKKQKIYSQKGSQDISLVRFVYSNSNHVVPVVVKAKDKNQEIKTKIEDIKEEPQAKLQDIKGKRVTFSKEILGKSPFKTSDAKVEEMTEKKSFSWNMELHKLGRPSYYLPVVMVLILFFIAVFGRSVAILGISIGWYLVPTLLGGGSSTSNVKRQIKKKEHARRLSDNKKGDDGSSSPSRGP
ncbi:hypothetical protein CFOL_v3_00125 [Cephalotus follicularis]|uniref:ZCF37 n=1 Tax=Cephalotus follicularis TaxID=3775 RepID=A0A1Q3AM15_CEPFO|nr:hypothetical protein CFOL_v3_00125 [Cephalotus follicularis]